jgi:magnesium chelatase family protein
MVIVKATRTPAFGSYSDLVKECCCTALAIAHCQKNISGPLLDRIDIHVQVPRVDYEKLTHKRNVEDSNRTVGAKPVAVSERGTPPAYGDWFRTVRPIRLERFKSTKLSCNAEMSQTDVRKFCQILCLGAILQHHP